MKTFLLRFGPCPCGKPERRFVLEGQTAGGEERRLGVETRGPNFQDAAAIAALLAMAEGLGLRDYPAPEARP